MDKIAQKLNGQDLIKANGSAEAAEMKKLQAQVGEYETILQNMRQINVKNSELTAGMERILGQVNQLLEGASLGSAQYSDEDLKLQRENVEAVLCEQQANMLDGFREQQANMVDGFREQQANIVDGFREQQANIVEGFREHQVSVEEGFKSQQGKVEEALRLQQVEVDASFQAQQIHVNDAFTRQEVRLDRLKEAIEEQFSNKSSEDEGTLTEFIHIESVKVYRNVQAVLNQGLKEQAKKIEGVDNRTSIQLKNIKVLAIVMTVLAGLGFVVSGVNMAFTIMNLMGIQIF